MTAEVSPENTGSGNHNLTADSFSVAALDLATPRLNASSPLRSSH
jgi:hypothetical protein